MVVDVGVVFVFVVVVDVVRYSFFKVGSWAILLVYS